MVGRQQTKCSLSGGTFVDIMIDTVDGRNPAPPEMHKALQIMGCSPYQLVQVFSNQHYVYYY